MFFDPNAWPPSPDGRDPPPPTPRLTRGQERTMLTTIGLFLLVMFLGPLAGSSVIAAIVALLHG